MNKQTYAYIKSSKLSNKFLAKSFDILVQDKSISTTESELNNTLEEKAAFIANRFEFVPVLITPGGVDELVKTFVLDIDDFKNKLTYKKGEKTRSKSIKLDKDFKMSLINAINDGEITSDNESILPRGRIRASSESDAPEVESKSSSVTKIRRVFTTTQKMDMTAIIPIWHSGGSRLERAKRAKDYVDDIKRFREASPSTSAQLLINQSLMRSNMRHIFAELPTAAKTDLDKFTDYILKVYGPNTIERISVWRTIKQEANESIRSYFYRVINSYFDSKMVEPLDMENLIKPDAAIHRNEIVESFLQGLRSNTVRTQLKARMLSINFQDIPTESHMIESAFESQDASVNLISDAHKKLETKLESSIQQTESHLTRKLADVCSQIGQLSASVNLIKNSDNKPMSKFVETRSCLYCKKRGHLIKNCWALEAKKKKDKEKAKETKPQTKQ